MAKVLVVALDALESTLFRRLLAEGRLPNFAAFVGESQSLDVTSDADIITGGLWPTFATGLPPGDHGIYFWTQWFAEEMRHIRNKRLTDLMQPFWTALIPAGQTATIIDVPYVPLVDSPGFRGYVSWGLHDEVVPDSSPADFRGWIDKTYGRHPLSFDTVEPHTSRDKLTMAQSMRRGVGMRARLLEGLAERQDWNLLLTSLSEVHMSGHYLTGPEQLSEPMTNVDAMVSVLQALDERWPAIVKAAGSGCHVMLIALHGMFEQREYEVFGPQILALFQGGTPVDWYANPDLLRRVRELLPDSLHRAMWRRLPSGLREARQHTLGSTTYDFAKDRIFTLVHEIHPAIRFNLLGREAAGFVPAEDVTPTLDALEAFATQFTTEDGQQAFTGLWRATVDESGAMSHRLPDAMILTNQAVKGTYTLRGPGGTTVTSMRREARNGTHNGRGFCYFRPANGTAATRQVIDNLDFAPTILELLDVPFDRDFVGASFIR